MSPGELLSLFGGTAGGTALVFCVLFMTGWIVPKPAHDDVKQQRDEYKRALDLERARSEASVITGQIVRDVMTSLKRELE